MRHHVSLNFKLWSRLAGVVLSGCLLAGAAFAEPLRASGVIMPERPGPVISRYVFGQFSEHLGRGIYDGIWVGPNSRIPNVRGIRSDVVGALKAIRVPVVRWPGGCFADEYAWRDGIGPRAKRPARKNNWWAGSPETNAFGTHEYFDFVEQIGADAYVSMNVGASTPTEMRQWVEYMTSDGDDTLAQERRRNGRDKPWPLKFVGIGNEYWGCGGKMTPQQYGREFMRFTAFYHSQTMRVAVGAKNGLTEWTDAVMGEALEKMDAISVHYYTSPTGNVDVTKPATGFDTQDWADTFVQTMKMDDYITAHSRVMDAHDPQKRVALFIDEWGTWYTVETGTEPGHLYQQNSLRDGLVAAVNFDIFIRHSDRVRMANIAQTVNVLQSLILTRGSEMVLTPTYYAYQMYVPFQEATALPLRLAAPDIKVGSRWMPSLSGAAARGAKGEYLLALTNLSPQEAVETRLDLGGLKAQTLSAQILTASEMDAHNDFGRPASVTPQPFDGARLENGYVVLTQPAKSLIVLTLK
ncbi:alpha-L-arabinofuranosidase C-terminal domain-containing protein [Asticcacaulis sp. MM231]|uniref:alpha-N-arabinofuranosidase n=1 Tax=Asticcacaulis sp. MM231 TaxID=3157666 RepID=UPI0032D5ADE2